MVFNVATLFQVVKKNVVDNIVPIVIAFKRKLKAANSPLIVDLVICRVLENENFMLLCLFIKLFFPFYHSNGLVHIFILFF